MFDIMLSPASITGMGVSIAMYNQSQIGHLSIAFRSIRDSF